jgi:hypothetical protein
MTTSSKSGKIACAICKREKEESSMKVLVPSDQDKLALKALGEVSPLDRYAYCKGCVQILQNPTTGLALIKGILKHHAKNAGVHPEMAQKAIDRFASKLLDKTLKN